MQPKTTHVVGYFNANVYPVHISDGRLGLSITIGPGEFVKDNQKNKVNDPILEQFVGTHMLSVEKSKDLLPVRSIIPPSVAPNNPYGFEAQNVVNRDKEGIIKMPPTTTQFAEQKTCVNPVTAMTIEQAKNLGLIAQTRKIDIENQGVSEEHVKDAKDIPFLPIASDIPSKNSKKEKPAPLPPETVPLPEKARKVIETLASAVLTDPDDLSSVISNATKSMNLPAPKLDDSPAVVEKVSDGVAPNMPFVCSIDGNKFRYRSELERHAKRTYDDATVQRIMAPYPKK